MPDNQSLQEQTHYRVLRILESNPQISQRELAERLGISLGKINYCVRALLDQGHIKVNNFRNNHNKLAYTYFLTPKGILEKSELAARFLSQKMAEYESLKQEIELLSQEVLSNHDNSINLNALEDERVHSETPG